MGIVHHATFLLWFEAGRVEYMHRRGVQYLAWAKRGLHLPVVEARVRYRGSVRFDERVIVETRLTELRSVRVRFDYRLLLPTPESAEKLIAEGHTLLACVDAALVPRRLPEAARDELTREETHPRPIDEV